MRLLLAALERLKMDVRPMIEGLSASEGELRAPAGRVDWDVWVELTERLEQTLGGPQALQQFAIFASAFPGLHQFQKVAQLISSPKALYRLNSRWGIQNQYRHARSECLEIAPDRLRISELAVLFMSGYAEDEIVHRGVVDPGISLLPKPFGPDSLARAVRKQLDDHSFSQRKSS